MKTFFDDVKEFGDEYSKRTNGERPKDGKIQVMHIAQMILDEINELIEAKNQTEKVDALVDVIYYAMDEINKAGYNMNPIWDLVQKANMSKFSLPGGYNDNGKWMKPPGFVPPDAEIAVVICEQQKRLKK